MRVYLKAGVVAGVHADDQDVPLSAYGADRVLITDAMPDMAGSGGFMAPAITPDIRAASIKDECRRRILARIGNTAQRNLAAAAMMLQATGSRTAAQDTDLADALAIFAWIGRPDGMQAASDALIEAADDIWNDDAKWPPWSEGLTALVASL